MYWLAMSLVFVVGVINFTPVVGVLSSDMLEKLYGIAIDNNNMEILLRHRALLFGLVGGLLIYSIIAPKFQLAAFIIAFVSMLGYMFLFWQVGDANQALAKVAKIDMVAILLLLIASIILLFDQDSLAVV